MHDPLALPGRNQRVKRRIQNLLTTILASVLGFLVVEVTLRLTGYEGDHERRLFKRAARYSTVRRDSWVLEEKSSECGEGAANFKDCKIRVGQAEVALLKNANEKRILFLGDSVTEGYGIDSSRTFTSELARLRPSVGVINAGVYGFNTIDEFALYTGLLRTLQADTVVLGLFPANDINFNLLSSERISRYPPWMETLWLQGQDHSAFLHFGYLSIRALNHRLRFASGDSNGMYNSPISLIEKESGLHMLHYREGEIASYRVPESRLMEHAYEILERTLRQFQLETAHRSARFVVLLLPSPGTVVGSYYSPVEPNILQTLKVRGIHIKTADLDVDQPRRRIFLICEKLGIQCVDATPVLRPIGSKAFIPGDDHLSDAGHSAVARLVTSRFHDFCFAKRVTSGNLTSNDWVCGNWFTVETKVSQSW